MVNRDRVSLIDSSERVGRWVMSTFVLFFVRGARYLTPTLWSVPAGRRRERGATGTSRYLE